MGERGQPDEPHGWREASISNRERINTLEREVTRLRERQHSVEGEVAATRYIGEQVRDLTEQIRDLAGHVQVLSRRALERPTSGGLSAAAGWVSVLIAAAALILVASR